MPKNSSSRDGTARMKRETSTRGPSSFAGVSKPPKIRKSRIAASASASQMKVGLELQLCSYCTNIKTGKLTFPRGNYLTKDHLDYVLENMDSLNCDSCELIGNAIPMNALSEVTEKKGPGAPFSFIQWGNAIEIRDNESFRLYGTLRVDIDYNECPIIIPETIDFTAPTAWLEHCKKVHGAACGQRDLSTRHSKSVDVILVDVIQNCITMKTTASRYFALSYVWGGAITTTTTMQNFVAFQQPESLKNDLILPKTVSDAMLLTREMDVRYLWVDCLSIIQDSPKKHRDIVNMDVIFAQAELTIVASCGRDANSGLAGVQQGTRRRRATSKILGHHILTLELSLDKPELLHGTIYSSRGWTFQELLLSKRVLFVTEHQVVFHCDASRRSESLPKEECHDNGEFGLGIIDLRPKESGLRSSNVILKSYTAMVKEYCKKRLSFQTDVENAFSGLTSILNEWCEGYPVIDGMLSTFFGHSMIWNFKEAQDYYSPYSVAERGKRREGFPSWSWFGWVACITNINSHLKVKLPLQSLMRNVEITNYGKQNAKSLSLNVLDKSAKEDYAAVTGQRIRINLEPAKSDSNPASLNTLGFDAERTEWKNFTVKYTTAPGPLFFFGVSGKPSECGFLSIAPDEDISEEVFNQAVQGGPEVDCNWSVVRLYHLRLRRWNSVNDDLQELLCETEVSGALQKTDFAKKFRRRLQRSNLLYVLLIRRHGLYWERVGSGLMFQRDWPSTSKQAKVRAYHERIVLI